MNVFTFGALCFSSLLTVIDPIAVAPIFVSLTKQVDVAARRRAALRACLVALLVLVVFALSGTYLLRMFGITIEAFRIAGGILFVLLGLTTLGALRPAAAPDTDVATDDPSVVPLGVPLIGGPGAMSTVMVLVGQAQSKAELALFGMALLSALLVTWLMLLAAPWLMRRLGATGVALTSKLMGLIVLVIGVQFMVDGVRALVLGVSS